VFDHRCDWETSRCIRGKKWGLKWWMQLRILLLIKVERRCLFTFAFPKVCCAAILRGSPAN
jgi:hypothetical protein